MKRLILAMLMLVNIFFAGNIIFTGQGKAAQIPQYDNTDQLPQVMNTQVLQNEAFPARKCLSALFYSEHTST